MENLIISLKVIAPLMIYMLLGVFFKRRGLISDKLNTEMNSFLVKVFLPVLMFKNIYQADLSGLNGKNCLAAMRSNDAAYEDIPAVLLSSTVGPADTNTLKAMDFEEALIRPYNREALHEILLKYLHAI